MSTSKEYAHQSIAVRLFVNYGALLVFGVIILISPFGEGFFEWLIDIVGLDNFRVIDLVYFGFVSIWLFGVGIWMVLVGAKSYSQERFPPEKFSLPFKSEILLGVKAKNTALSFLGGGIVSVIFAIMLTYSSYVSHSSGL